MRVALSSLLFVVAALALACDPPPGEGEGEEGEGEEGEGEGEDAPPLALPTRGSSITADEAGTTLVVANKASDSVTFFDLTDRRAPVLRARVDVGDEPVSVSLSGGGVLYVVNRAASTVVEVEGALTATPTLGRTIAVGTEPILGALSPSGTRLYVTSEVDGSVTVVDTATMTVSSVIDTGGNPHGVCVTNDNDDDDNDESIFVTDFYARPISGVLEGDDGSRFGRVFQIDAQNEEVTAHQVLPLATSGVPGFEATAVFPNQLSSCAVNKGRVYVTAVGASPESFNLATPFQQNVQGLISVLDELTGDEVPEDSISLNAAIAAQTAPRRFASIPLDIGFVDGTDFGYVISLAADAAFRVDFTGVAAPVVGVAGVANFLAAGKSPSGIAVFGANAYVNNEVGRSISVLDLATQQTITANIESEAQPTDPAEVKALLGQRFFDTGLARWSTDAWVSCAACHPGGGTDNVTWSFPTGPRQTIDLTGTFSADGDTQRILNWTAIFDEVHDFELNTRNVAGGTGAIVSDVALNADGTANVAVQVSLTGNDGNLGSAKAKAEAGATPEEWNDIEAFVIALRTPRGDGRDVAAIDRGRAVFTEGNCQNCHGGPLWTLSERYYEPVENSNFTTLSLFSQGVLTIGQVRPDQVANSDTNLLNVLANDTNGGTPRHTCVVRKVDTFDENGPDDRGAAEVRANGAAAQGVDGYNVPSLLGVGRGAPYLHSGAAETLEQLFDPAGAFVGHLRAGNLVFAPDAADVADLAAFLRSIDDTTAPFVVPAGQNICPAAGITP